MEDWEKADREERERWEEAHALYQRVMKAICAKIPDDLSPGDPKYQDVADLCEACFLTCSGHPDLQQEKIIKRILRWPHGYSCWLDCASVAMQNADLSFLENPDELKAELCAAYRMACAWIWDRDRDPD